MIYDTIEKLARERVAEYEKEFREITFTDHFRHALIKLAAETAIAILTDPQVGFKEALELAHRNRFLCQNCRRSLWDKACPEYCPCPCHTAEAKLAELKELEKGK